MHNLLINPLIQLDERKKLMIIFFIAPVLNFIFGVSTDMYSPALPIIEHDLHASYIEVHKTLDSFMFGFFFGCLTCGPIMDRVGSRKVIILSLVAFICFCSFVFFVDQIEYLQILRLFQGICVGCFSIGSRVLIFLHFKGKKYQVGITYTSFAYGIGVISGPFLGGNVIINWGWQFIFVFFIIVSLISLVIFTCAVPNTKAKNAPSSIKEAFKKYLEILSNKYFVCSGIILGLVMFQELSFSIFMPYFLVKVLKVPLMQYGFETMFLGVSFLMGVLTNKQILVRTSIKKSSVIGYLIWGLGIILYCILAYNTKLSVVMVLVPSLIITFSIGFIFPNVLGYALKINPDNVGLSASAQSMLFMLVCTFLLGLSNKINFINIRDLALFFGVLFLVQLIIFFGVIYRRFKLL